jgi:hypothetical protein
MNGEYKRCTLPKAYFITLSCRRGVPKEMVILVTGHKDTTLIDEVYNHPDEEFLREKTGHKV